MKKITLALLISNVLLFGASNQEIIDFYTKVYSSQIPDVKISVIKREKIPVDNFESVILDIQSENFKEQIITFTKDSVIVPDILDLKNEISYRQAFEMEKIKQIKDNFEKNAKNEVKKETMLISLGDKTKPSMYVFSDPECPYCRKHLKSIKQTLKDYQVHLILTPVHDKSAFEKAALIYKEIKGAKNDEEKIAILNKYFDPNIKDYPSVNENELLEVIKLNNKYQALGLMQVPTIIKDDE
ncbi:thioredoxin fold domain-containing protein [Campylobacter sp. CCS1377]|uniref:Thioredoxin fold domain-containing protein n=1 Tax=Campylobacter sp. CCS1377 TaxID=3158229 RepID=A0AAU7E905_9BACT|nr:thioredoxin fold domain-containing protein [Campylobacter jejuni]